MTVTQYSNPILRGMYPDPSIVRVDNYYYMVNSTFEYYPGIALSRSSDLLNWEQLPSIASKHSQANLTGSKSNEGIFAVCIRYHAGSFYVITTNFAEFKTFIITGKLNTNGAIVWSDKRINIDINGIDPDIFFENDHTFVQYTGYLKQGTKALQQVEIDLKTGKILVGPKVLTAGTGGRDVEGPHIIKNKDYYYLLAAEGGTGLGHMITIFRSKSIWGPFEGCPINPIFTNRDRADEPIQNIGHGDLFKDVNGNWWLVCLGTRPANVNFKTFTNTGRETLLYPVQWDNDWPIINNGVPTQTVDLTKFPKHALAVKEQSIHEFNDNFKTPVLKPQWVSLRDSLTDRISINNESLTLTGSDADLTSIETPSFLGIRQSEQNEEFVVTIDPEQVKLTTGQFGLALTIDNRHFASLTIKKNKNQYEIIEHIQVFDLVVDKVIAKSDNLPTTIKIINHPTSKEFIMKTIDKQEFSFKTSAMHFSNEAIGALNTGDMFGIYALGNDTKVTITSAKRSTLEEENIQ